ncbi:MAG: hypothetical protein O2944_07670 [Proteobacteria bacterium]|nr:hypothetical protein [Pseudomonadota bacterium]
MHLPFSWYLPAYRTLPYGVFAGIGRLAGTLWAIITVQSLLTAYVLHETFAVFAPGRAAGLLALVAVPLTTLSGLAWFTGQIMPDAMTGPVVLCVITLAFASGRLARWRQALLAATLAIAVTVHTTHLAVGAGLVIVIGASRWLLRRHWGDATPQVLVPSVALVLGVALVATVHWFGTGRAFVAQPSAVLWVGRLVQDGILQRFLDDNCKTGNEYQLCQERGKLPDTANSFLWDYGGVPYKIYGNWENMRSEARKILEKSLRDYPLLHLSAAIRLSYQQLIRFKTGDGLENTMEWLLKGVLRKYYPDDLGGWQASRQMRQPDGFDFGAINGLHVPAMSLAQLMLIGLIVVAYRRREKLTLAFSGLVLVRLLGNAFVCGALSNPNARYQSRLVWIAVIAIAIGGHRLSPPAVRRRRQAM